MNTVDTSVSGKITLAHALFLFRSMYPDCGDMHEPLKVDVGKIEWPFPFSTMWREGGFILGHDCDPVTGSPIPVDFVLYLYDYRPEFMVDEVIAIWKHVPEKHRNESFFDFASRCLNIKKI